jgi:hypothetical protein
VRCHYACEGAILIRLFVIVGFTVLLASRANAEPRVGDEIPNPGRYFRMLAVELPIKNDNRAFNMGDKCETFQHGDFPYTALKVTQTAGEYVILRYAKQYGAAGDMCPDGLITAMPAADFERAKREFANTEEEAFWRSLIVTREPTDASGAPRPTSITETNAEYSLSGAKDQEGCAATQC